MDAEILYNILYATANRDTISHKTMYVLSRDGDEPMILVFDYYGSRGFNPQDNEKIDLLL